ncbi:class I SAM-dependent methyltransferase [Gordonia sp. (in: high G+C Gram-positive bacteria)]|uniref:class I SAM-dependent methyltransferase n=1 Tax=Gordonia sp. (in: high G+C Gram-positive bacteria) TaxID=84139 RepID=UPI0016AF1767|nr:class I SAM-dependent methyltransferase [Gordonia sp. (in: high G+C Gram-positive bacteria)]NLG44971.1 class I SAM-dependent methyltransferase [Gordonia sp. (in: high G+C Gram-positive bacteria)]
MNSPAARLMQNRLFSQIYEKLWRPVFTRGFSLGGSATADYDRALRAYLARPGERAVLDVACGPGNYAADAVRGLTGRGHYVGLDFSAPMLAEAARVHDHPRITFIRGDAHHLPLTADSFDTATCLAALYLIPDPLPVLDEMFRVLRPGGELIVFTSVDASVAGLPGVDAVAGLTGLRIFGRREIVDHLEKLGMMHVEQTITGTGQYVHAHKPA